MQAPFPQVHIVQSTLCSHTDVSLQLAKTCLITQMPVKAFYVKPSPTAQGQECRPLLDTDSHHLLVLGGTSKLETLQAVLPSPSLLRDERGSGGHRRWEIFMPTSTRPSWKLDPVLHKWGFSEEPLCPHIKAFVFN